MNIAAIMKDAENVDYALAIAGTIDDEVLEVLHNSKSGVRPFAAETQVIRSDAFLTFALVFRAWALHVGLDIAKGLDNEVFITQGSITAKLRLAPYKNLEDRVELVLKERLCADCAF